ncbi:heme exporter protein CcmD [Rhodophyticola sp. CCM32]|uniref:heme exporter protein CcmD n=1 Tax=Rhodophyticola sp. CCM32 TaxID=2916397 RepID=UPI00107F63C6|nr:heme exporter protein CcmD [Rhodophyticola sp. CCM32]
MPDLGRYATEVLLAYGGSLALLVVMVAASVWQSRRVRRRLEAMETRRGKPS